jgi:hypothetical protein
MTIGQRMRLEDNQLDEESLASFAVDAARLLCEENYPELASRFGYALAFDRVVAEALEQDLINCLREHEAQHLTKPLLQTQKVGYFKQNEIGLYALAEITLETNNRSKVLLELIITSNGNEKFICIEDIS